MLILMRRIGEILKIGDDIDVEVLGVNGKQVKLGITAPDKVAVHRKEIWDKIQREKENDMFPDDFEDEKGDASGNISPV